ncbi:MAG TPA: acetolactate synthase large subunit, partial [Aestuariivirga sp.]|nr:acetolactate synthase large subunit [Aestuariivirga sp.]
RLPLGERSLLRLARTVSGWVRTSAAAAHVGRDAAVALQAARTAPGEIASLILPSDASWNEGGVVAAPLPVPAPPAVDAHAVTTAAKVLREKRNVLLLLGGNALMAGAQVHAARIQARTGCRVMAESINGFHQRGVGRLALARVPYGAPQAIEALKDVAEIVLVNARVPVGFFAYPGLPSLHAPEAAGVTQLSRVEHNAEEALARLADALGCGPAPAAQAAGGKADIPGTGPIDSEGIGHMLAAVLPEGAIVADEGISLGWALFPTTYDAPPHDWMMVTGGAIGYGMPCATGAAMAGGGRRVINMQADGSAMYTLQALWTQARERLPVTTVILSNRKYQILIGEYAGVGANPGPTAMNMLDLGNPDLDWVRLAQGMGVEAARAETLKDCAALMLRSFKSAQPFLIELVV